MARLQYKDLLWAFSLLPLLGILWYALLQWKKSVIRKLGNEKNIALLTRHFSPAHFRFKFLLSLFAIAFIILGAANVQRPASGGQTNRKGLDILIALDLSRSMLADDIAPSRLEKARQLIYHLLESFSGDRIGLVFFAGRAYLQMPLSHDHHVAKLYIQNADPTSVPTQGTVIGEALKMCNAAFLNQERKYKSVILITDGEDHDPEAIKLIPSLQENGIMVNTIGIGSPAGARILDPVSGSPKKDNEGSDVLSRLNEPLLQQLAAGTQGIYVRLEQVPAAMDKLNTHLDQVEQTALADTSLIDYESYFQWFLGAALILLVWELFWPERKWKTT